MITPDSPESHLPDESSTSTESSSPGKNSSPAEDSSSGEDLDRPEEVKGERRERYALAYRRPDPTVMPRICPEVEPIGGYIKTTCEDFEVTEVPLYSFSGSGEHCYVTLRKINRTTLQVRDLLARLLDVGKEDIGFAGFKDKRAVAEQTFSILGVSEQQVAELDIPFEVIHVTRHKNKLRPGHLSGNRFKIVVRDVPTDALDRIAPVLEHVREYGVPNFYGFQRFGVTLSGHRVGEALLHRDPQVAVDLILGPELGHQESFREHYARGEYDEALEALPPGRPLEATLLHGFRKHPGNHRAVARRIPKQMRRMFFSAFQAFLFNWALLERIEWGPAALRDPVEGDLVTHAGGRGFREVRDDLEELIEGARAREVFPTGPMFGRKMRFATERPGALEWSLLAIEKLRPQSFVSQSKGLHLDGTRRPLRIVARDLKASVDEPGTLTLQFELPSGSFATVLLDQIMGPGQVKKRQIDEVSAELPSTTPEEMEPDDTESGDESF